jgi:SsrA-binding protein
MAAKSRKENVDQSPAAVNKKAYHNYELTERFEAGLSLLGSEVKSLRTGQADLAGSYARVENRQGWLIGVNIARYEKTGTAGHEPTRKRKLLLHKNELRRIQTKLDQRGFTLIPLRIYFNDRGLAKVELALARGKRKYDKRRKITEREQKKGIDRDMKKYHR